MSKNRALYIGPSHAAGGIPVTIDGVRQVEVEGLEYKICGDAYRSNERLDFKGKTNIEVLDHIHKEFSCKFEQNKASGTDFIICKLAVRDIDKHDRSGTVREILDQMQGEVGCKLSDGSMPEKKLQRGGLLPGGIFERKPLFGEVKWTDWDKFNEQNLHKSFGLLYGQLNIKRGASFDVVDDFEDIEEVIMGKADLYDFTAANIVRPSETSIVISKAVTMPGNTVNELKRLAELPVEHGHAGSTKIDYNTFSSIKSIEEAAKILGFDGICLYSDKDWPSNVFVWNLNKITPIVIFNSHNFKFFSEAHLPVWEKFETGGKATGYEARVKENLAQMGTVAEDWKAVPVVGTQKTEAFGKERDMPVFDFPQGYSLAPSIYKNDAGPGSKPCCELCGKEPIGTFYWIQNDKKQWTMGVGSECIKHFQQTSGKEMLRAAKIEEAKDFISMLRDVCLWIKRIGYKSTSDIDFLLPPKRLQRDMSKWSTIWQNIESPFIKNHSHSVYLWSFYDLLFPFNYDEELNYLLTTPMQRYNLEDKKWVSAGPPERESCVLDAEKKLLSWYSRNKDKKMESLKKLSEMLLNQQAKFVDASDSSNWVISHKEKCDKWNDELLQICGEYLNESNG